MDGGTMETELSTRLQTIQRFDEVPPCVRVSWIGWDSGFRGTDLRIGDRIVAVDGTPFALPSNPSDRGKRVSQAVGQYDEARFWADAGAHTGQTVRLTVRRRNRGGTGWQQQEIAGTLQPKADYRDADNEPLMCPGGPRQMGRDDFDDSWSSWYDSTFVPKMISILDEGWRSGHLVSQFELKEIGAFQPRVDFLSQHYPGTFAASVAADYAAAVALVRGTRYDLPAEALKYRQASDERVQQVAGVGQQAWAAMRQALAAETIDAFPAIDPIRGNRDAVIGKIVVLPPITNQAWVPEAGHNYLTSGGDGQGWYFADAESDAALRMLRATARYGDIVSPNLSESYELVGRIQQDPRLLVMDRKAIWGMQIDIVGALVGGQMFVDLSQRDAGESRFAGESDLMARTARLPSPDAPPAAVVAAMVQAIKEDDRSTWLALFANWQITPVDGGGFLLQTGIDRTDDAEMNELWDASRRSILGRVFDARVVWTDDPVARTTGKEFPGAPAIEEAEVELELIGQFEGEFRGFVDVTVHPVWRLQRSDGGPWRIASVQDL
jgi:hypothetical protein